MKLIPIFPFNKPSGQPFDPEASTISILSVLTIRLSIYSINWGGNHKINSWAIKRQMEVVCHKSSYTIITKDRNILVNPSLFEPIKKLKSKLNLNSVPVYHIIVCFIF